MMVKMLNHDIISTNFLSKTHEKKQEKKLLVHNILRRDLPCCLEVCTTCTFRKFIILHIAFASVIHFKPNFNPYYAEYFKWNIPPYIFGTVYYHFMDIEMRTWIWLANSIVWSDCTDVQAGLFL